MLLTVSKRLEFSASRRLAVPRWTEKENLAAFGEESRAKHGTGRNYTAYFIFSGGGDPLTGKLFNINEIKHPAREGVVKKLDHKFPHEDNTSILPGEHPE